MPHQEWTASETLAQVEAAYGLEIQKYERLIAGEKSRLRDEANRCEVLFRQECRRRRAA